MAFIADTWHLKPRSNLQGLTEREYEDLVEDLKRSGLKEEYRYLILSRRFGNVAKGWAEYSDPEMRDSLLWQLKALSPNDGFFPFTLPEAWRN